jgi:hypothetical protein
MKVTVNFNQMLGHESKMLNRESKKYSIGKLQYQSYPQVKSGDIVKGKYIVQLNYNGKMIQGGMKRGADSIKNWPSHYVHYLMKNGFKFDTQGNCYIKRIVDANKHKEVEDTFLKAMVQLRNK